MAEQLEPEKKLGASEFDRRAFFRKLAAVGFVLPVVTTFGANDAFGAGMPGFGATPPIIPGSTTVVATSTAAPLTSTSTTTSTTTRTSTSTSTTEHPGVVGKTDSSSHHHHHHRHR